MYRVERGFPRGQVQKTISDLSDPSVKQPPVRQPECEVLYRTAVFHVVSPAKRGNKENSLKNEDG